MQEHDDKPVERDDDLPQAYGKLSDRWETFGELQKIGWRAVHFLHGYSYAASRGLPDAPLWEQLRGAEPESQVGQFKRRPCDQYTLRSQEAAEFEKKHKGYFRYEYQYSDRQLTNEAVDRTLNLAVGELCELAHLFPLAATVQAARGFKYYPFVMRVWRFQESPRAFMKTCNFELEDGTRTTGGCIVYEPPKPGILRIPPLDYYYIFRSVVAHEVAHMWWDSHAASIPELKRINDAKDPRFEQAVSLFSIFLVMYRGAFRREPRAREEIEAAFDGCEFETRWMHERREQTIDRITGLESRFPEFVQAPESPEEYTLRVELPDHPKRPPCRLGDRQIRALREAARRVVANAEPLALASTAAAVMLRKIDCCIRFITDERTPRSDISWSASDRTGTCYDDMTVPKSEWRDYAINVPVKEPGVSMPDDLYLSLARQLAHIRLHGGRPGGPPAPMKSGEVWQSELCTEADRDLARLTALALYAHRGRRERKQFFPEIAQALLTHDESGLRELVPYVNDYFQWCTRDERVPAARDHYLGQVDEIDELGQAKVTFWQEDGRLYNTVVPKPMLDQAGLTELKKDDYLKLFAVYESGVGTVLRPYPIGRSDADERPNQRIFDLQADARTAS